MRLTELLDSIDDINEIQRISSQDFPLSHVKQVLSICHPMGTLDGFTYNIGEKDNAHAVILTSGDEIVAFAGFAEIKPHRWQVRNAQTYNGHGGKRLIAKIYHKLFNDGIALMSDFQQSIGAEKIWVEQLPSMGLRPMVWDSETSDMYYPNEIGMDKIYSDDPKTHGRYCWILDHYYPGQNIVSERSFLLPVTGLWYSQRV